MNAPLRALIIEDSEDDTQLIVRQLRGGGFEPVFERVDTIDELKAALERRSWDVVISDYTLRRMTWLTGLPLLWERNLDLPYIVVSDDVGEDLAAEAIRSGASDFIRKSNLARLVPAIERGLREAETRREHRLAQEALVLEKQRLDDVTHNANCGLLLLDAEARVTYANELAQEWFGPLETMKGRLCWQVFRQTDPERQCAGLAAVRTGKTAKGESFTNLSNGAQKYFYVVATPVKDSEGRIQQITEIVVDITERKRAEDSMRRNSERLRAVVTGAPVLLYAVNRDLAFTFADGKALRALGINPGHIFGRTVSEVFPGVPEFADENRRALDGERFESVLQFGKMLFEIRYSPIEGRGGRVDSVIGVATDVTERKRAEEAVRDRDREIRKAYAEVFSAVTDEKLLILTEQEIEAALGDPASETHFVSSSEKIADARLFVKEVLKGSFPHFEAVDDMVLAACEAVTNGIKHAGSCAIQLHRLEDAVQVRVSDRGPGIDFGELPKATLLAGYSTRKTLGMGFTLMLESCDRMLLSTASGGTAIVLESDLGDRTRSLDEIIERLSRWSGAS